MSYIVVATGHRIDAPDRPAPRFPHQAEPQVATRIAAAIDGLSTTRPVSLGIAAGANGVDLLFHEACHARSIATELHLALHPADFVDRSVEGAAGSAWNERFETVRQRAEASDSLFVVKTGDPATLWQRANLAMLHRGEQLAADEDHHALLLAVWDGTGGDGPGGTADMIAEAELRGYEVKVLPVR